MKTTNAQKIVAAWMGVLLCVGQGVPAGWSLSVPENDRKENLRGPRQIEIGRSVFPEGPVVPGDPNAAFLGGGKSPLTPAGNAGVRLSVPGAMLAEGDPDPAAAAYQVFDTNQDGQINPIEAVTGMAAFYRALTAYDADPASIAYPEVAAYDFDLNGAVDLIDRGAIDDAIDAAQVTGEVRDLLAAYLTIDGDQNGDIPMAEATTAYVTLRRMMTGSEPPDWDYDFDRDGLLTENDAALLKAAVDIANWESLAGIRAFDVLDADQDGQISGDEAAAAYVNTGRMAMGVLPADLAYDFNQDHAVTEADTLILKETAAIANPEASARIRAIDKIAGEDLLVSLLETVRAMSEFGAAVSGGQGDYDFDGDNDVDAADRLLVTAVVNAAEESRRMREIYEQLAASDWILSGEEAGLAISECRSTFKFGSAQWGYLAKYDFNQDNVVDFRDLPTLILVLAAASGHDGVLAQNPALPADLDRDGSVTWLDLIAAQLLFLGLADAGAFPVKVGDLNHNSYWDPEDRALLASHLEAVRNGQASPLPPLEQALADIDGDLKVTYADQKILELLVEWIVVEDLPLVFGDVTGNRTVTSMDTAKILAHIAGTETLSPEMQVLADMDNDSQVTYADAKIMGLLVVELIRLEDLPLRFGDADGDGLLSAGDVSKVSRYLEGLETLSPVARTLADMNNDNTVTDEDRRILEMLVNGTITVGDLPMTLPAGSLAAQESVTVLETLDWGEQAKAVIQEITAGGVTVRKLVIQTLRNGEVQDSETWEITDYTIAPPASRSYAYSRGQSYSEITRTLTAKLADGSELTLVSRVRDRRAGRHVVHDEDCYYEIAGEVLSPAYGPLTHRVRFDLRDGLTLKTSETYLKMVSSAPSAHLEILQQTNWFYDGTGHLSRATVYRYGSNGAYAVVHEILKPDGRTVYSGYYWEIPRRRVRLFKNLNGLAIQRESGTGIIGTVQGVQF